MTNRWLLPEAIDEVLPPQAQRLELLRRQILDLYHSWGYQLVMPPLVEFLDALLTGVGSDLDTQTFKLTDQASGRLMGVRADMTPQVARIDAHQLKHNAINRLCYFGTVLRTKAPGVDSVRNPLQVGAELFGSSRLEADIEIAALLIESLQTLSVKAPVLDISHVDIVAELVRLAGLNDAQRQELFTLLQRKAIPLLKNFADAHNLSAEHTDRFIHLAECYGSADMLATAKQKLGGCSAKIDAALDKMDALVTALQARYPNVSLHIDLAELTGYSYQTGLVFAAFVPGISQAVARGGRYDGIGASFNPDADAARPATGFSIDIKTLLNGVSWPANDSPAVIQADAAMSADDIGALRAAGNVVLGCV